MAKNKSIVNAEMPKSIDNAITNLTDQPTKNIGSTLADIWFLVFGGIGQMAEKRKMRYAVELEKYSEELNKKLDEVPPEKRVEPDTQVIAPALEASKYCVEKEVLRSMFVDLITSSMNSDKSKKVHPIFTDIISKLSETDALLFKVIANSDYSEDCIIFGSTVEHISFSLAILKQLGLVVFKNINENDSVDLKRAIVNNDIKLYNSFINNLTIIDFAFDVLYKSIFKTITNYLANKKWVGATLPNHKIVVDFFKETISLSHLGEQFKEICL